MERRIGGGVEHCGRGPAAGGGGGFLIFLRRFIAVFAFPFVHTIDSQGPRFDANEYGLQSAQAAEALS